MKNTYLLTYVFFVKRGFEPNATHASHAMKRKHFAMRLAVETTLKQVTGRRFRFGAPVGGNEIGILPGFLKNSLDYHELFNA